MKDCCCQDKLQNYNVDTYIEQRLLDLCSTSSRKIKIYFDWQSCKEDYEKRTSTIVYDFQHYSLHDRSHSVNIIECIEMFLGEERIRQLEIGDLWLILQVAYGHDVGMCIRYEELKNLWDDADFTDYLKQEINNPDSSVQESILYYQQIHNRLFGLDQMEGIEKKSKYQIYDFDADWPLQMQRNVNLIICEYFRRNHAKRSKTYIEKYTKALSRQAEQRLYQLVGKVSYAHSADFQYILENIPYEVDGFCNEKMHPQFVAALLRLGDLLDMDNNRFDSYALEHFGELPKTSELHLEKHLSISHLRITDIIIESVAETESIEVARIAQRWFSSLEEEIRNITSNWNRIAPEDIGGCIFKQCDLQVYLCGNRYTSINEKNFNIDKRKLITLLMGSNIYDGELTLFREYIQNAMDATKVKIWLDVLNGDFDYYLIEKDREKERLLPFDLKKEYLQQLTIDLSIEVLPDSNEVKFAIRDKGIGIDDECIDAISNIGKGWRGREKYRKYIAEMPAWLRPTGGFGIGMQSGFMLTNQVTIVTKSKDQSGMKVTLFSPDAGGEIIREHYTVNREGTEISFVVPLVRLYAVESIRKALVEKLAMRNYSGQSINGYFDYVNLPEALAGILEDFLMKTIPNNLIPISIRYGNPLRQTCLYGSLYESLDKKYEYNYETKLWHYYDRDKYTMQFWDETNEIYANICPRETSKLNRRPQEILCFKNVIVKQSSDQSNQFLGGDIACKEIDFMGFKTEECLKIHRNEFLDKFDVGKYDLEFIHSYVNWMAKNSGLINEIFNKSPKFLSGLILIDGLYYGMDQDVQKLISSDIFSSMFLKAKVLSMGENQKYRLSDETFSVSQVYSDCIGTVSKMIIYDTSRTMRQVEKEEPNRRIPLFNVNDLANGRINDKLDVAEDVAEYLVCRKPVLMCSPESGNLLEDVLRNILNIYDPYPTWLRLDGENNRIFALIRKRSGEERTEVELYNDIVSSKRLYIKAPLGFASKYSRLLVKELPFSDKAEEYECQGEYLIVIPFDSTIYGLLEKGDLLISLENFIEKLKESSTFKACVQWVLMHPADSMQHSNKQEIEADYIEFSKKIFLQNKETKRM